MKFSSFFPFFGTSLACLGPDSDPDPLIHMIRIRNTNTCLPALTELQCCKISLVDQDLNSQIKYTCVAGAAQEILQSLVELVRG